MRSIELEDEVADWLREVMQNPLYEIDPNNEDPMTKSKRRAVWEATLPPKTQHILSYEELQRLINIQHDMRIARVKGIEIGFDPFQAECKAIWRKAGCSGEGTLSIVSHGATYTLCILELDKVKV